MSGIPDDIRKAAMDIADALIPSMCMTMDHSFGLQSEQEQRGLRLQMSQVAEHDVARAIAKAIHAERERCAYIAESIRRENDKGEGFDSHSGRAVAWEIRELITQGAVAAPKGEA